MARAIGRFMAALIAAESHLWLTLTGIKDKEKAFLLDPPVSQTGLFGLAIPGPIPWLRCFLRETGTLGHTW